MLSISRNYKNRILYDSKYPSVLHKIIRIRIIHSDSITQALFHKISYVSKIKLYPYWFFSFPDLSEYTIPPTWIRIHQFMGYNLSSKLGGHEWPVIQIIHHPDQHAQYATQSSICSDYNLMHLYAYKYNKNNMKT